MGFKDKEKNLIALMESKGDLDGAIEKLCQDWLYLVYIILRFFWGNR